jgi:hypothetical protein
MEAYFATPAEMEVHPYTEQVQIELIEYNPAPEPKFAFDRRTMQGSLTLAGLGAFNVRASGGSTASVPGEAKLRALCWVLRRLRAGR